MSRNYLLTAVVAVIAALAAPSVGQAAFVRATLAGAGPGLTSPEYVIRIDWVQAPTLAIPEAPWLDHNFSSFCIQREQDVGFGGTYEFTTKALENSPVPGAAMEIPAADRIRRLWAADRAGLGTDNYKNAAFQIAIWTILNSSYLQNFGSLSAANQAIVNGYVATYLGDSTTFASKANLIALTSISSQDQIVEVKGGYTVTGDEVVPTPAPAGLILAALGIPAFGLLRRIGRKTRVAVAS